MSELRFKTEIPRCSRIFLFREQQKYTSLYGRRTKGHLFQNEPGTRCKKMYFLESIVAVVSYLVHYNTLLQNATNNITKCDGYFITKCYKSLLQNESAFLLQYATVITKCISTFHLPFFLRIFLLRLLY